MGAPRFHDRFRIVDQGEDSLPQGNQASGFIMPEKGREVGRTGLHEAVEIKMIIPRCQEGAGQSPQGLPGTPGGSLPENTEPGKVHAPRHQA
jgi:hypothetical protein